jgi:oligopeptide transport system ATP-binding protein
MTTARRPLLDVVDLVKTYGAVRAVDRVSFTLGERETLGCVGESGCGKTTLGRAVLRLVEPDSGSVVFHGPGEGERCDVLALRKDELRRLRRQMQIVFQDPYSALNPRFTVRELVGEAILAHRLAQGSELDGRVVTLLEKVGLGGEHLERYPHEFSGGQRQRICIARAIALDPRFLVCDEPVSALDVSVQAQVVNLFERLEDELGLAYLFISHDLAVVRHLSDRVIVLYLGEVVEEAPTDSLFAAPRHPYTRALLASVPVSHPDRRQARLALPGEPPSPSDPPSGCRFRTRCPLAKDICAAEAPPWRDAGDGHRYRCHFEQ